MPKLPHDLLTVRVILTLPVRCRQNKVELTSGDPAGHTSAFTSSIALGTTACWHARDCRSISPCSCSEQWFGQWFLAEVTSATLTLQDGIKIKIKILYHSQTLVTSKWRENNEYSSVPPSEGKMSEIRTEQNLHFPMNAVEDFASFDTKELS